MDASPEAGRPQDTLRWSDPVTRLFTQLLVNVLVVSVVNYTVWFAITFFAFLQTRSVFVTGLIAGIFMLASVATGIPFGSVVDHHDKKRVMQVSAAISTVLYAVALALYLVAPDGAFTQVTSPMLWIFVLVLMAGVIVGNLRNIALPTVVTALMPPAQRARANGLVGTTSGVSFLVTSVISALLVGWNGMTGVLVLALVALVLALGHLHLVRLPALVAAAESEPVVADVEGAQAAEAGAVVEAGVAANSPATPEPDAARGPRGRVDLRGTIAVVVAIPGMAALIVFSAMNNLLAGVFLALLDAYGLSMVSVQSWGLIFGAASTLMIAGGLLIARTGLSGNPVRLILLINLGMWSVTVLFPLRESIVWLVAGIAAYMMMTPYAEAAEQTVMQQIVPYARQGRVFGFAQSIEQASAPLTAFVMGPITQYVVIPFMTDGYGAQTIGSWFGTGPARGMALVFVVTGACGVLVTLYALGSRYYRELRDSYRTARVAENA